MIRTRRKLHRGHRGTEDAEKHPARGSSPRVRTSAPASPGAVEKEVGCPFIRKDRNWEYGWYRRGNFLASVDRQIRTTPRSQVQFAPLDHASNEQQIPRPAGVGMTPLNCGATCIPVHRAHSAPAESRERAYIYSNARVKRAGDDRDARSRCSVGTSILVGYSLYREGEIVSAS